jgi:hypothetical protein
VELHLQSHIYGGIMAWCLTKIKHRIKFKFLVKWKHYFSIILHVNGFRTAVF